MNHFRILSLLCRHWSLFVTRGSIRDEDANTRVARCSGFWRGREGRYDVGVIRSWWEGKKLRISESGVNSREVKAEMFLRILPLSADFCRLLPISADFCPVMSVIGMGVGRWYLEGLHGDELAGIDLPFLNLLPDICQIDDLPTRPHPHNHQIWLQHRRQVSQLLFKVTSVAMG